MGIRLIGVGAISVLIFQGCGSNFTGASKVQLQSVNPDAFSAIFYTKPTIAALELNIREDEPKEFQLTTEVFGNVPLTYRVLSQPKNGTVEFNVATKTWTYIPSTNFFGRDTFELIGHDGKSESNSSTVAINVAPVDDKPTTANVTATTNEDSAVTVSPNAVDVDGDQLAYVVTKPATKGQVTFDSSTRKFIYVPNSNIFGSDSFEYKANDGKTDSNISTVSLMINSINDAPLVAAQAFNSLAGFESSMQLVANDIEGSSLSLVLDSPVKHGTLQLDSNGVGFTFKPNSDFMGEDSFTVKVSDGSLASNAVKVTLNVAPITGDNLPASITQNLDIPRSLTVIRKNQIAELRPFFTSTQGNVICNYGTVNIYTNTTFGSIYNGAPCPIAPVVANYTEVASNVKIQGNLNVKGTLVIRNGGHLEITGQVSMGSQANNEPAFILIQGGGQLKIRGMNPFEITDSLSLIHIDPGGLLETGFP